MMKSIVITDESIRAVILPDFGGIVSHLQINGTEVLRMDEELLGVANTLSGGIPVLFPFVSGTPGNEAIFCGQNCTMPNHGFAKDLPFDVIRAEPGLCELSLTSSAVTRHYYPFDFELRLIYEAADGGLHTTMTVQNTGCSEMPFAAGFHPYFLTPDRTKTHFSFGLTEYWNYLASDADGNPLHGMLTDELRLWEDHDTVFWNGCPNCELICEEPFYRARLECGSDFDVITVCTTEKDASCIEPWQARPGAAHRQEECQKLKPGEKKSYRYTISLSE